MPGHSRRHDGWHGRGLLISTRTGGHGSRFVVGTAPGAKTEIELPLGRYTLVRNGHRKVFVATGTGLAPFLPMFRLLSQQVGADRTELIFGCRTQADDLTRWFEPLPAKVVRCISHEASAPECFKGRVSGVVARMAFEPDDTDFYVCGSAAMVSEVQTILQARGAQAIHIEAY